MIAARLTRLPALLERPRPRALPDGHWFERELWPDPPPGTAAWLPWRYLDDMTTLGLSAARSPALDWPGCRDPAQVRGRTLGLHVDLAVVEPLLDPGELVTAAAGATARRHARGRDRRRAPAGRRRRDRRDRERSPRRAAAGRRAERRAAPGTSCPTRLARSLTAVAAVTVLHAETVREALDALLGEVHVAEGDAAAAHAAQRARPPTRARRSRSREFLASLTGASKTAKTAKALLARTGTSRHAAGRGGAGARARASRAPSAGARLTASSSRA